MATNQEKLDAAYWAITQEGRDFADRHTFSETNYPNAWGHPFPILTIINGIERRAANIESALNAQVANLVGALGAISKGESFDEAKLLAGVQAAAAAGVKSAIESIDTTVTIKG